MGREVVRGLEAVRVDPVQDEFASVAGLLGQSLDRFGGERLGPQSPRRAVAQWQHVAMPIEVRRLRIAGRKPDLARVGDAAKHRVREAARAASDAMRRPRDRRVDDRMIGLVVEEKQLRSADEQGRLESRLETLPRAAIERALAHRRERQPASANLVLDGTGHRGDRLLDGIVSAVVFGQAQIGKSRRQCRDALHRDGAGILAATARVRLGRTRVAIVLGEAHAGVSGQRPWRPS